TRARYPEAPWSLAARTRDRLTHRYFEIDLDRLWSTATESLPALLAALRAPGP
ncbi:MAG: HepT-like ribonuclease domain-containing protein, partial [Acidimicrobiia bacterium]